MNIEAMKTLIFGAGAPIAGILVSLSTHIPELQALSLLIGCLVGGITLVGFIFKGCKKIYKWWNE